MQIELNPCRKCGNASPHIVVRPVINSKFEPVCCYQARCSGAKCWSVLDCQAETDWRSTEQEAREEWNAANPKEGK